MQDSGAAKIMPPVGHVRVSLRAELLCDEIVRGGLPGGASGVVEAVGDGLANRYRPGQRVTVVLPASGPDGNSVPAQRVALVPDDVNDEEAAFGALAAVVLEAVHRLDVRLGDIVAVAGLGLLGLIAAELLELSGIRFVALDDDPDRLALARYGRPALAWDTASGSALTAVATLTAGRGCDALIVCRTVAPAKVLASLVRPGGRVRLLDFGAETLSVDHLEALMAESRSLSKGASGPPLAAGLPNAGWRRRFTG